MALQRGKHYRRHGYGVGDARPIHGFTKPLAVAEGALCWYTGRKGCV